MSGLLDYLPDADALTSLTPEGLGMILLELMQQIRSKNFGRWDFETVLWNANVPSYSISRKREVRNAIAEAWQWLENEGLVIADPDQPNRFFCLTRKGAGLRSPSELEAYRHGNLLPEGLMHPKLVAKVRPMFLRGDYDVAVVQAFKQVEIAVRGAAGLSDELVGTKLMRTAYNPETGPLADANTPAGERQAVRRSRSQRMSAELQPRHLCCVRTSCWKNRSPLLRALRGVTSQYSLMALSATSLPSPTNSA